MSLECQGCEVREFLGRRSLSLQMDQDRRAGSCCRGERAKVRCCCCSTVTIIVVTLIATSVKPIDPNTIAIEYNPNTQSIDETKLYGPGRPFLGPGHYFIKFPTQNGMLRRITTNVTASGLFSHCSAALLPRNRNSPPANLTHG